MSSNVENTDESRNEEVGSTEIEEGGEFSIANDETEVKKLVFQFSGYEPDNSAPMEGHSALFDPSQSQAFLQIDLEESVAEGAEAIIEGLVKNKLPLFTGAYFYLLYDGEMQYKSNGNRCQKEAN